MVLVCAQTIVRDENHLCDFPIESIIYPEDK